MDLLKEILIELFSKKEINVNFNISNIELLQTVDSVCFKALMKIREVIKDNSLDDFQVVEEIVCLFESLNIDFGSRHDFG